MKTPPADVDPAEWIPEDAETRADTARFVEAVEDAAAELPMAPEAVPLPSDANTPPVERTNRHSLGPADFASAVDLADRDGYGRGLEHGQAKGKADALAEMALEVKAAQEDCIDVFRQLFVIFEIKFPLGELRDWPQAEAWLRRRFKPA